MTCNLSGAGRALDTGTWYLALTLGKSIEPSSKRTRPSPSEGKSKVLAINRNLVQLVIMISAPSQTQLKHVAGHHCRSNGELVCENQI